MYTAQKPTYSWVRNDCILCNIDLNVYPGDEIAVSEEKSCRQYVQGIYLCTYSTCILQYSMKVRMYKLYMHTCCGIRMCCIRVVHMYVLVVVLDHIMTLCTYAPIYMHMYVCMYVYTYNTPEHV